MSDDQQHVNFYFSDGRKIPLEEDHEHAAVYLDHPAARRLPVAVLAGLKKKSTPLRGGISLVPIETLSPASLRSLNEAGAAMPVYRDGDVLLVVLPEIRAEVTNKKQMESLHSFLKSADVSAVKERGSRVSFAPATHRGLDALKLANELYEQAKPALSQARFLRIVPAVKQTVE